VSSARTRVLVAMSGGVDSSVAAALLVRAGYDVVGCFMRLGSSDEPSLDLRPADGACDTNRRSIRRGCCSVGDAADARLVAAELGIPLYVCNFRRDFDRVIGYFVDEYARGRTPNPCVRCNDWLKFGRLREVGNQLGARLVASGHYARIMQGRLRRAVDTAKDQSYVLFGMPREHLAETIFPIGTMQKNEVRDFAQRLGLPVFDKPDSQEICFVPDNDYAGLVERRRPELAVTGAVLDSRGNVLARHAGQHRYTIGQRRGLPLALGRPLYVVEKDAHTNTVVVAGREGLLVEACEASEANWLIDPPGETLRCTVQYRAHAHPVGARVRMLADDTEPGPSGRPGRFEVTFDEAQQAVAPGQAIVLYEGDTVLAGGWITRTIRRC
jgi:tRNA-specific 2-thiouridylase